MMSKAQAVPGVRTPRRRIDSFLKPECCLSFLTLAQSQVADKHVGVGPGLGDKKRLPDPIGLLNLISACQEHRKVEAIISILVGERQCFSKMSASLFPSPGCIQHQAE